MYTNLPTSSGQRTPSPHPKLASSETLTETSLSPLSPTYSDQRPISSPTPTQVHTSHAQSLSSASAASSNPISPISPAAGSITLGWFDCHPSPHEGGKRGVTSSSQLKKPLAGKWGTYIKVERGATLNLTTHNYLSKNGGESSPKPPHPSSRPLLSSSDTHEGEKTRATRRPSSSNTERDFDQPGGTPEQTSNNPAATAKLESEKTKDTLLDGFSHLKTGLFIILDQLTFGLLGWVTGNK